LRNFIPRLLHGSKLRILLKEYYIFTKKSIFIPLSYYENILKPITKSPAIIETRNENITFFQNSLSQNLHAIDHFTKLFDITANRIVLAATEKLISPLQESTAIV
jgi:hypothetical protein